MKVTIVFLFLFSQDNSSPSLSSTHVCYKCEREFNINDNPGGKCVHVGTWHAAYNDCSYLKCGLHLGKKGSIGKQHWSCCYSFEQQSDTCKESGPHTHIKHK